MSYDPDRPVITVTATIMDGTVVRWFTSIVAAEAMRPWVSASRRGVAVHAALLTDIPEQWVAHAINVYRELAANADADVTGLATHRRRGLSGPFEEVRGDPA